MKTPEPSAANPDWSPAAPQRIPNPTVWPAALSLGVTLLAWGLIGSCLLSIAGGVLVSVSLWGWVREIRHERNS